MDGKNQKESREAGTRSQTLKTIFCPKEKREDLSESFVYRYPETEELDGYLFRHIYGGVYAPSREFTVTDEELERLSEKYPGIEFWIATKKRKTIYRMTKEGGFESSHSGIVCFAKSAVYSKIEEKEFISAVPGFYHETKERVTDLLGKKHTFMFSKYPYYGPFFRRNGCKKMAFVFPDENNRYKGYPKHIVMGGCIGYLFCPGFYYFKDTPWVEVGSKLNVSYDTAIAGYDDLYSASIKVSYLAVGQENIKKLSEAGKWMGRGWDMLKCSADTAEQEILPVYITAELEEKAKHTDLQELVEWQNAASDKIVEKPMCIENSVKELIPGFGIRNLKLAFKYIFFPKKEAETYLYAYMTDHKLVLIKQGYQEEEIRKEYYLCMLEELIVFREEMLNCGVEMEKAYPVINCREEKEKQVFTPEAYRWIQKIREEMPGKKEANEIDFWVCEE